MVHRITVENFFSIGERQEIYLPVAANAPDLACFRDSQGASGARLPVIVGFYGPNASGKTTVLRAITAVATFLQHSFAWSPDAAVAWFNPYAQKKWADLPSTIVIDADGFLNGTPVVFRYELQIANSPHKFAHSVLVESMTYRLGRTKVLFQRHGQAFEFGREFGIADNDPRLQSIRPNASLVTTLAQLNHGLSSNFVRSLQKLQTNLVGLDKGKDRLTVALAYFAQQPGYLKRLNQELGRLDLGLEEMKIHAANPGPVATFKHVGLDCEILMTQESEGTRRFIQLFPQLQFVLDNGGLAVIDELDTDVHPLLIPELFRWFTDPNRNSKSAQLLFTAHNPAILDELEKEQVFFCEKPGGEPTRVYGARDIKGLRREPSLMRKYLSGELGAVPHIG